MSRLLFLAGTVAVVAMAQGGAGLYVKNTLLVQRKADVTGSEARGSFGQHGAKEEGLIEAIRVHVLRVPDQAIERVSAALLRTGKFEFVEREGTASAQEIPTDPYISSQWHLYKIEAPAAWLTTTGSANVPIAVIDSGIDAAHPDLSAKVIPGYNFIANNTNTADVLGHGTKVAGSAAASANNGIGVVGVAQLNPIMPLVALDASNYASYSNIARGITYAADRGVRVINISITGSTASSTLQSAVNYAWNKGAVVIAAAGNSGTTAMGYPAACDKAIAVGATNSSDARESFSNYGSWIDVTAPGSGIYTTVRGGSYAAVAVTSFASPITAGVAALMLSVQPALTATQLTDLLKASARDLGVVGFDANFGAGRVDANQAVVAASQATVSAEIPVAPAPISPTKPGKKK